METISEDTKIKLSPRNFIFMAGGIGTFVRMYFTLQAQIEEAKTLPAQDQEVKEAVIKTSNELTFIKEEITEIKGQLQIMEERLYELQK
ncbi:MAG: hypothetical protein CMI60_23555 [Parvibaculum sp.]|nr:hypothetical protein [Parvibaculum sp.]